jgi:flagellar basal body rod protein FlgG
MNVGLYSGAAGMRVGEDYQQVITENLSLQSVPGYKQMLPVFSTDPTTVTNKAQLAGAGNPAAVRMTRIVDFSQGPVQPSGSPYHLAIQGKGFFEVREADGSTTYTRNGSFSLSPKGQLMTSDGATVLSKGGSSPVTIDTSKAGDVAIGTDGTISIGGEAKGSIGMAHFDNPTTSLQPGAFGRFIATNSSDAKMGPAPNDKILQGSLEESNGNPVTQMANMIMAARIYEANSKSMKAVDDNQNQLITNLGAHPQA